MKFFIQKDPANWQVNVMGIEDNGGRKGYAIMEDGSLKIVGFVPGEIAKPLLSVPLDIFDDLVVAMATYAKDRGLDRKMEDHNAGELVATKRHLNDMRAITKILLQTASTAEHKPKLLNQKNES